jgi:hypothetical protein
MSTSVGLGSRRAIWNGARGEVAHFAAFARVVVLLMPENVLPRRTAVTSSSRQSPCRTCHAVVALRRCSNGKGRESVALHAAALPASIAEAERGEVVPAQTVLDRLRRHG